MGQPLRLRAALPGLGRLVRRLWPDVRRERPLIVVSLLALYAEFGPGLLEAWALKVVLDHVVSAGHHGRWVDRVLAALDPGTLLALAAVAVVAFAGLRAVAAYSNTVGLAVAGTRLLTAVRNELYAELQRLSLSFHTRARTGDLIVRVTSDVGFLQDVVVTAFLPLLASGLTFVGMAGVMLWLNAPLALLAFATGPLFFLSTVRLSRRIRDNARRQRQQRRASAWSICWTARRTCEICRAPCRPLPCAGTCGLRAWASPTTRATPRSRRSTAPSNPASTSPWWAPRAAGSPPLSA